jgi:hypothetical protein
MNKGVYVVLLAALAACSEGGNGTPSGAGGSGGGVGGSGGSATTGGSAGVSGAGTGTGGQANPNWCALQGDFNGDADLTFSSSTCSQTGIPYSALYDITISGTEITITNPAETVPMTGTIDAQCRARVVLTTPYREFQVTLDPSTMAMSGTYTSDRTNGCRSVYDLTMTLAPGHG